jgi:hypothetical protein
LKKILFACFCIGLSISVQGQDFHKSWMKIRSDEEDRKAVLTRIFEFYEAMRTADSLKMSLLFDYDASILTLIEKENGEAEYRRSNISHFIQSMKTYPSGSWTEIIDHYHIHLDGSLASVWTDYNFFFNNKHSHCGSNSFHLIKKNNIWKIKQIHDTYKKDCMMQNVGLYLQDSLHYLEKKAALLLDKWHQAAALADENMYFDLISDKGYFLGTDPDEKWTKTEFRNWAKPYFEKGSTWNFQLVERQIFIAENQKTIWFDEKLNTDMGICRGSGVLVQENKRWKIIHYNLSISIPNNKMKKVMEILAE